MLPLCIPIFLNHITHTCYKTSRDNWTKIECYFVQQSTASNFHLRRQLHTLKKENISIADYLTSLSNIGEQLQTIEDQVPDEELVLFVLSGFPSDYSAFVTTIENLLEPPTFFWIAWKAFNAQTTHLLSYHSLVSFASGDVAFMANTLSPRWSGGHSSWHGGGQN